MSKIEAVLTAMNDGDSSGLRGRLGYLNLQNFPPGLRVGKARRVEYELDDVLVFTIWFALTRASFTPSAAMALVADMWPEFTRLFLAAAQKGGTAGIDVRDPEETIAVITANALAAFSKIKAVPDDVRAAAQAFDLQTSTRATIADKLGSGLAPSIVMDFEGVRDALYAAMGQEPQPVGETQLDEQVREIATREGWSAVDVGERRPIQRVRRKEIPARGERLGEADYFFSRAVSLIDAIEAAPQHPLETLRATRLARYLFEPAPRERWKQWVAVGESDIPFVWGMAAYLDSKVSMAPVLPETVLVGTRSALSEACDSGEMGAKLRAAAVAAQDFEPVEDEA